jgi:glucose-1-phosphate cytidylyltransferase
MSPAEVKEMKVVILCGGLGTRLREETEYRPKPMAKIGNKPILWHIMKSYAHYGFKDFVLCLGYKGEVVKDYFYNYDIYNNDFSICLGSKKCVDFHNPQAEEGWRISLVDTGQKALKGARIKRIQHLIDDDHFMLTYGDGVANIDLRRLLDFHLSHGRIGTVTGVRPPSLYGELQVSGDSVEVFSEKPQASGGMISGGFFVFSRKLFDYLSDDDDCDLERGPLEQLSRDGQLNVYDHRGEWACMDNYRDFEYLNALWAGNRAFWRIWE